MGKIIIEDGLSLGQNRGVGQYTLCMSQMLDSLGADYEIKHRSEEHTSELQSR